MYGIHNEVNATQMSKTFYSYKIKLAVYFNR